MKQMLEYVRWWWESRALWDDHVFLHMFVETRWIPSNWRSPGVLGHLGMVGANVGRLDS